MSGQGQSLDPLPHSPTQWLHCRARLNIGESTLHTLSSVSSASTLTEEQFLCMRALWPDRVKVDEFPQFPKPIKDEVEAFIENFSQFKAYTAGLHLEDSEGTYLARVSMEAFILVWQAKLAVQRKKQGEERESTSVSMQLRSSGDRIRPRNYRETSTPASQVSSHVSNVTAAVDSEIAPGPTEDEQIVNDALLLLLRTLVVYWPKLTCRWSSGRSPFEKAEFGLNSLTARTDGYLEANGEVFAIIEVKPYNRGRKGTPRIFWQETGEMIAWIMQDQKHGRKCKTPRYLIISQDNQEIYLTIANFSKRFVDYLTSPETITPSANLRDNSFLVMQEYGPWLIGKKSHMESLAKIILSVALEVTYAVAKAGSD